MEPREIVTQIEASPHLPSGSEERFNGYGIMGLPFSSGHILAMRRFPASSVGPGYTSVWHRSPEGEWTFYADVAPRQGCTRFFGAIVAAVSVVAIPISWSGPRRLSVLAPEIPLEWEIELESTVASRAMNALGRLLPERAWRNPRLLTAMGFVAERALGVGRVSLTGAAPNGQAFVATPRLLWLVAKSRAFLGGRDLGPPGPVAPQARVGDFWIPQQGVLAIGQAYFEPFDSGRHLACTTRDEATA